MNDKDAVKKLFNRLDAFRCFAKNVIVDGNGIVRQPIRAIILWEEKDEKVYQEVKKYLEKAYPNG